MNRDLDRTDPERGAVPRPSRTPGAGARVHSRDLSVVRFRGAFYRFEPGEFAVLRDIGRFRTVAVEDVKRAFAEARVSRTLSDLRAQGLIQLRTVWTGPKSKALKIAVLSRTGKTLLDRHFPEPDGQAIYAGFVKPNEVRHDAGIYRMFQAERQRIEASGGVIRRIVLDYELKRLVYTPLAKAKTLPSAEYSLRQAQVAQQHHLRVIDGKIPLPDLRIEFEAASGELARVDLELATEHYHGPALQAKAQAGFQFYAPNESRAGLTRVLEDRGITVAILSL
jgi:hypothetical protein